MPGTSGPRPLSSCAPAVILGRCRRAAALLLLQLLVAHAVHRLRQEVGLCKGLFFVVFDGEVAHIAGVLVVGVMRARLVTPHASANVHLEDLGFVIEANAPLLSPLCRCGVALVARLLMHPGRVSQVAVVSGEGARG